MLNKSTTSTGTILLLGLSSFVNVSSSDIIHESCISQSYDLYAIELEYNAPEMIKTRVDTYVDFQYRMNENLANKYSIAEYGFMSVVQKFAQEQSKLDSDFTQALDELFTSKLNAKPTKKRF